MKFLLSFYLCFILISVHGAYDSNYSLVKSENKKFIFRSLLNFEVNIYKSEADLFGYKHSSTVISASYETRSIESLKEYGIVQFIKGCVFEDVKKSDGTIVRQLIPREYFGNGTRNFSHKEWEIDSVDTDPVYGSIKKEKSRLGSYFWIDENLNPIFDKVTKHYYLNEKPTYPRLMITDMPSGGSVSNNPKYFRARSSSLEFKICIYKMKKIPLETISTNTRFARPLKCFNWNSSHIYNKETKSFDKMNKIHPFCKQSN